MSGNFRMRIPLWGSIPMLFLTRDVAFSFDTIYINIPEDAILVTIDVVELYPSIMNLA